MQKPASSVSFRQCRSEPVQKRPMSTWDGFFYNVLAMGFIFPWIYFYGPALFPQANLGWAIALTVCAQLPISLTYCVLSTVLPISGGDYIYQTRAFGRFGFTSVMSGFVIGIMVWIPISGKLFIDLGLVPLLYSINVDSSVQLANQIQGKSNHGIALSAAAILLSLLAILVLQRGLRLFSLIQRGLFALTMVSVILIVYTFHCHATTFVSDINSYAPLKDNFGSRGFVAGLIELFPEGPTKFSSPLLATLAVVPLAWTGLQWATYSVLQNTEIEGAEKLSTQLFMLVLAPVVVGAFLILVAHFEIRATDAKPFINAVCRAYIQDSGTPAQIVATDVVKKSFPPFPNTIALALTKSRFLKILISLGFLANAFQVTCNCFIGMARIMKAMSTDGMLPAWITGTAGQKATAHPALLRYYWIYFVFGAAITLVYSFSGERFQEGLVGTVTIACGSVFILTSAALVRVPYTRMRNLWMLSSVYWLSRRNIIFLGIVSILSGGSMLIGLLFMDPASLGLWWTLFILGGILAVAFVTSRYALARNPEVDKALKKVPREMRDFS